MTGPTIERQRAVTKAVHMVERDGWAPKNAARACGVGESSVYRRLRLRNGHRKRRSAVHTEEVVRRLLAGERQLDIAVDLELSTFTIDKIAARFGIRSPIRAARHETKQRGLRMARQGRHLKEIVEQLGVHVETARKYYRQQGLKAPQLRPSDRVPNAEIIRAIRREGHTYRAVARKYGITASTVAGVIHRSRQAESRV